MKILIADDDDMILRSISHQLKENGYSDLFVAKDGKCALDIITENNVDVVISDVMMPGLSGLTLMRIVEELTPKKVLFIFISSLNQIGEISKQLDLSPYEIIVKPVNFNHLFQKLEKIALIINR